MTRKKSSETREKIHSMHEENEYKSLLDTRSRARSITVGTAFGGIVEIVMRNEFSTMYSILQPVEAVEIMEQIAAGCGIEIAMRPKQNFTSWREWSMDNDNSNCYMKGSAPWQLEGQEFGKKLQAVREDMQLELEKAKIEFEMKRELKKIQGQIKEQEEEQKSLPQAKTTTKRKRAVKGKSAPKTTTNLETDLESNEQ